jgi:hypothetical protein
VSALCLGLFRHLGHHDDLLHDGFGRRFGLADTGFDFGSGF